MAKENSFDITCEVDAQELRNAVDQAARELAQRFDFRGSQSNIEQEGHTLRLVSDDEFKLKQVVEILQNKLVKRGISLKFLSYGKVEEGGSGTVKQQVTIQHGIDADHAKTINKMIKEMKRKVTSQVQGDQIRVSGKNKDDLQAVISALQAAAFPIPLSFVNYR